jgi:hypothetical protein
LLVAPVVADRRSETKHSLSSPILDDCILNFLRYILNHMFIWTVGV